MISSVYLAPSVLRTTWQLSDRQANPTAVEQDREMYNNSLNILPEEIIILVVRVEWNVRQFTQSVMLWPWEEWRLFFIPSHVWINIRAVLLLLILLSWIEVKGVYFFTSLILADQSLMVKDLETDSNTLQILILLPLKLIRSTAGRRAEGGSVNAIIYSSHSHGSVEYIIGGSGRSLEAANNKLRIS